MNDPLHAAMFGLTAALDAPAGERIALGTWRWTVRQRLAALREALAVENAQSRDAWLAPRSGAMLRERNALLTRMATLGPRVLDSPDVESLREELRRLVGDVSHHRQRTHDLLYDEVEMELGGSE